MKRSHAFTVIELIFVIVVLGILASVALPKFSGIREQADIAKGKGDVATIRAGIINERQTRLIKGDPTWITPANLSGGGKLFDGVLTQGFTSSSTSGKWDDGGDGTNTGTYRYYVGSTPTSFVYEDTNGTFKCTTGTYCSQLIE